MATQNDHEGQAAQLEYQREMMDLLSQETRHAILQVVLGHPTGLASEAEIAHRIPEKSDKAVSDQIDRLVEESILGQYIHEPSKGIRDLPSQFYGLTVNGAEVVGDLGYFNSVPMMRAIHQRTATTDRIERHRDAPRPELPGQVRYALRLDEDGDDETDGDDSEPVPNNSRTEATGGRTGRQRQQAHSSGTPPSAADQPAQTPDTGQ